MKDKKEGKEMKTMMETTRKEDGEEEKDDEKHEGKDGSLVLSVA